MSLASALIGGGVALLVIFALVVYFLFARSSCRVMASCAADAQTIAVTGGAPMM